MKAKKERKEKGWTEQWKKGRIEGSEVSMNHHCDRQLPVSLEPFRASGRGFTTRSSEVNDLITLTLCL